MALTKVSRDLLATGIDDNSTSTAITIDSGQRVGLGTTSPTATFRASIKGDYSSVIGGIEFDSGGGDKFTIGHASATSPSGTLNVVGAGNMIFKTNNAEVGRFSSTGHLLVGTNSVAYSGTDIHVGNTSDSQNGIQIQTSTTGFGYVLFGDGTGANAYKGQVRYSHADDYMAMFTAGSEAMRIDSSGNVGVGISSPSRTFHSKGASGISTTGKFEAGGSQVYVQLSSTGQADGDSGYIGYDSSKNLTLFTDNIERMRIDSSGTLLVGKTADDPSNAGHVLFGSGAAYHIRSGGFTNFFNRTSSDGEILRFAKDGTAVGSIGSEGGDALYIQSGTTSGSGLHFHPTSALIRPARNGATIDGVINLGASTRRFRDLHLSTDANIGNQILGGFGAQTTSGTTDWNHSTNARSGMGITLLLGTHTNGPGVSGYFHPVSFEYNSKNGTGNMTQLAIGYTNNRIFLRYRYSNSWSSWVEL